VSKPVKGSVTTPTASAPGSTGSDATAPPSATAAKAPTRERLLEAACDLFYREGTVAVGVDKICQQAQVSKRSMYQLFSTKDELVAASLQLTGERQLQARVPTQDDETSPREKILSVFDWLERMATGTGFVGCPFVNAATELKDPEHPGSIVARHFKQRLTDFFTQEAAAAGVADPELLGQQLTIVFDGCGARVVVAGRALDGLAVTTAATLLDGAARA
jgi:AcrR family transcriptional regulator